MGPTASSRAKIAQSNSVEGLNVCVSEETPLNTPSSSLDPTVEQSKENIIPPSSSALPSGPSHPTPALGNHSARAALRLDLIGPSRASLSPASLKTRLGPGSPCRQALVTPTEMRSLGKECRKQIINIEESLAPKTSSRLSTGSEMFSGKPSHAVVEDLQFTGSCENTLTSGQIAEGSTGNDCFGENTGHL